ncbi:hypothetical protein PV10_00003 [Exophiala mesophila]|uniref:FAD-binding domain-containing protein n=1 Tax=Exophiala mesophila TaxID=212818 RepID=A0A0D1ZQ73_EXOME|nr:uncharacterized protein PV10_00003 [Exophiala mesophila]KIV96099.1 hypothetical protein PV10_00003 [Exophiala mesophila]
MGDASGQDAHTSHVQRHPDTGITAVIVGGGVGGIMTALECWRKGIQVRIYERSSKPETQGDFFSIGPSACKAFEHWPVAKEEHEAASYDFCLSYHKQNGEHIYGPVSLSSFTTTDEVGESTTNTPRVHRHLRSKFQKVLLKQLNEIGVSIQYNHRAVKYDETHDKAIVEFDNGVRVEADLVVAADGIGTKSFEVVTRKEVRARSSGYAMYRTAYPIEFATADPEVDSKFGLLPDGQSNSQMWVGPDMHLFISRTPDIFSWNMTHKDTSANSAETWYGTHSKCTPADAIQFLATTLGSCPEILRKVFNTTPEDHLVDWKLLWRDPESVWTSPKGRVIQLGDAAHTFVPSSGNGATQAIEDAMSLASCLEIGGKSNVPMALRVHNLLRAERVSCCQLVGFRNQANRHNTNWDLVLKNPQAIKESYDRWLWAHDPEQYAYENYGLAVQHLITGAPFKNTNVPPGYVYKAWNIDELLAKQEAGIPIEV